MFAVVITTKEGDKEYRHHQRKIAERQFEMYQTHPETLCIALIHNTKRVDDVLAYWERPNQSEPNLCGSST